jgi:hypothetical protein
MFLPGAVLLALILAPPASATKEGPLPLYSVILDSPGMGDSGPVHVEMRRSDKGIEKLIISAFGRSETAPTQLLRSIKMNALINGVQLSWVRGFGKGKGNLNVVLIEGVSMGALVVAEIGFGDDGKFAIGRNLSQEQVEKAERSSTAVPGTCRLY